MADVFLVCFFLFSFSSFSRTHSYNDSSYDCYKKRNIRAGYNIRESMFELERGVCQICGIDAHDMFRRFKMLVDLSKRKLFLSQQWPQFKINGKTKLYLDPMEGDFYQIDHIVPVVEGGYMFVVFFFSHLLQSLTSTYITAARVTCRTYVHSYVFLSLSLCRSYLIHTITT